MHEFLQFWEEEGRVFLCSDREVKQWRRQSHLNPAAAKDERQETEVAALEILMRCWETSPLPQKKLSQPLRKLFRGSRNASL